MPTIFSLDDKSVSFGTTPLDNQFILEYMPAAKGDYVKVYLYGLFQCMYPQEGFSMEQMRHDLAMPEEDILAAYRYWERIGLVTRVSDHPPVWRYVGANQRAIAAPAAMVDRDYSSFCEAMYQAFGSARDLEAKELSLAYEWKLDMGLPTEVILMLINHMIAMRGTNFSFQSAQKLAVSLADNQVRTIEDAERILGREKRVFDGSKKLVRRMGKRRDPSEDEQQLYRKWTDEWGFSHDAIEAACAETTKGEPTFGYLDGILAGMRRRSGRTSTTAKDVADDRQAEQARRAPLRALLDTMGLRDYAINEGTLKAYEALRDIYPDDIILLAGRECSKTKSANLETVEKMLLSWQQRGFHTQEDIQAYIDSVQLQNRYIRELCAYWDIPYHPNAGSREMIDQWMNTWHLSWEEIMHRAAEAKTAEHPMKYLNTLLDPEHADSEKKSRRPGGKTVTEQQYSQREYEDDSNRLPAWMTAALEAENHES